MGKIWDGVNQTFKHMGRIVNAAGTGGLTEVGRSLGDGGKEFSDILAGNTDSFKAGKKLFKRLSNASKVSPPAEQYWGGSRKALDAANKRDSGRMKDSRSEIDRSSRYVRDDGRRSFETQRALMDQLAGTGDVAREASMKADAASDQGQQGYVGALDNYNAGREGIVRNADSLEGMADSLPGEYQQTADKAAALNRSRNTRAAVSAATSGGGQVAIRNALNAAASANTDAAVQAELVRANELNQIKSMQMGMRTNAAGIRSNVAGQDLNAAQLGANVAGTQRGLQTTALGTQTNALGTASSAIGAGNKDMIDAEKSILATRSNQEMGYLGSEAKRNEAQLIAARERELAAQQNKRSALGGTLDPAGMVWK